MKNFLFKLKTAWNAYKTAGDILAAEKAFEEECKYELTERAKMDFLDAAGNQVTRPPFTVLDCAPTSGDVIARANECGTLHPAWHDEAKSELKAKQIQRKMDEIRERMVADIVDHCANPPYFLSGGLEKQQLEKQIEDMLKSGSDDAVISKPRVVKRKVNVTMAKRRKNANKRKTK